MVHLIDASFFRTKQFSFVLLVCLLMVSLVLFCTFSLDKDGVYSNSDFLHHFSMAQGKLNVSEAQYHPFFRVISSPFAFNIKDYYIFTVLLIFLLFPLALFIYFKEPFSVLAYFAVSFAWRMDVGGFFPQAFASFFVFLFIVEKRLWVRLILLFLSLFVHNQAFYLLLVLWLLEAFFSALPKLSLKTKQALSCVPFATQILKPADGVVLSVSQYADHYSIGNIIRFFSRDFNLFFLFLTIKGFAYKRFWYLIVFSILVFFASMFVALRVSFTLTFILLIGTIWGFQTLSKRWKQFYIVLSLLLIALNFYLWFLEKQFQLTGVC